MTIDWSHFTPWSSLAGGVLIGLAAAMLVLLNGRIAGISGIVGGLVAARRGDTGWRVAFVRPPLRRSVGHAALRDGAAHRRGLRHAGGRGPAGRPGHELRLGLHERPRRLRDLAPVAALARRHRRLHGGRRRDGLPREALPA